MDLLILTLTGCLWIRVDRLFLYPVVSTHVHVLKFIPNHMLNTEYGLTIFAARDFARGALLGR